MGGNSTSKNPEQCEQYDFTAQELERMKYEGFIAEDGCFVEPDNVCPHGLPGPLAEQSPFRDFSKDKY